MSIPERIFRISKAYLHQVRDRIDSELSDAERELDTSLENPNDGSGLSGGLHPGESDTDAMMRRAEEKIAAARRDLESQLERQRGTSGPASIPEIPKVVPPVPKTPVPPVPVASAASQAVSRSTEEIVARNEDPNAADFRLLGVAAGSDLATVTASYEHLAQRCDSRRFPDGSPEQRQAQQILEKVTASYEAIRRRLDPTSNRFGKLEFE